MDDLFKWFEKVNSINIKSSIELDKLQNEIIADSNSYFAYLFAADFPNYKPHKMQQVILRNKDAKNAFYFAQYIPNADIKALQSVIIDSNKLQYIAKFACFINFANISLLESIILKSKNAKYALYLLKHNKTSVKKVKKTILSSKDPKYIFAFAKYLTNKKDIIKIEDLLIKLKAYSYIRMFAEKIKLANIEKLEKAILKSNNIEEIKKFAISVKKSKMKQFLII